LNTGVSKIFKEGNLNIKFNDEGLLTVNFNKENKTMSIKWRFHCAH